MSADQEFLTLPAAGAPIGHNSGNVPADETIGQKLRRKWATIFDRMTAVKARIAELPERIEDEETATVAADIVKIAKVEMKAADETRKIEKQPYADAGAQVDATFKKPAEELAQSVTSVQARLTAWLQLKEERERERRRQEAERLREEAEARMRAAEEAEAARLAADQAARDANAAREAARFDKADALEQLSIARRLLAAAVADKRTAKAANAVDAFKTASEAEAKYTAQIAALNGHLTRIREQESAAAEAERRAQAEAKSAAREVKHNVHAAGKAETRAERTERSATASAADLSRTRGDLGSVSSLRVDWFFDDLRRGEIDLEALRQHIPLGGLESAVRSWIDANKEGLARNEAKLRGVRIWSDTSAVVR